MTNLKEIKERIETLKKTTKLTSTMKIVATTQFKKLQRIKPFEFLEEFMAFPYPLSFEEGTKDYVIAIASNRGRCGSYNNMIKKALIGNEENLIVVGQKIFDLFHAKQKELMPKDDFFGFASDLFEKLHSIKSIKIYYTHYINPLKQEIRVLDLVNHIPNADEKFILYEGFGDAQVAQYKKDIVAVHFCYALFHASISENIMRMIAMDGATKNGEELLNKLTLEYNKIRQGNITREVSEIGASLS